MPEAANQGEPDLDIVVVTFNSAAYIDGALRALPAAASLVVVDNASTDDSAGAARGCGAEVIESDVNAGFAASANRGARVGCAPFILFLNPDAQIERDDLGHLMEAIRADARTGIVGPRLRSPDLEPQQAAWPFPSLATAWREAIGLHRVTGSVTDEVFVVGAALLIRRTTFEELHGFDERFWLYAEETDLCRRALDAGWQIRVAPDAVATHVGGASGEDDPDVVFDHFNRGLEHYIAKRLGRRGLLGLRAALATGSAVRALAPGSPSRRSYHRRRLRRLATEVRSSPMRVPLDSPATRAPGKGIVLCSLEPWDDVWRRNQFLVRELLRLDPNRRILVVEPPFDVVHERRNPSGRPRRRGLRSLADDGRVVLFEPGKTWPRILGPLADRSLHRQVRAAARRLGFDDPTLWVNDPSYAGLAGASGWPALYDITDDWTQAEGPPRVAARVARMEDDLFVECASVVVCSPGLARSHLAVRPDLAVIPNAVDVDHFRRPQARPADLPSSPTAVYVGTLHADRIDVALVEALASSAPDLAVVLIGPDALPSEVTRRLVALGNVHVLGSRPYTAVPAYLQHADVVIVPHVVTPFTDSLDPIKAYECLAVGRPTIAAPVAGFRDLGEPVTVAQGDDFVAAVRRLVAPRRDSSPRPVPTWAERGEAFDAELLRARAIRSDGRLRIVYLDHCAQLSGAELALARLIPALDEVDAHVILGEHGPLEARLRDAGASVEVLALDRGVASTHRDEVGIRSVGMGRLVATARDTIVLARRLRELGPDLVETNSLKAALYGGVAARLARVPVVWHIHDRIADDYLPRSAVRGVRILARLVPDAIVANSDATRSTLRARDVVVIPNALERRGSDRSPAARAAGEPFRVAMVGRLAPWKGQDVFVEAFGRAFPGGDERAVIVGSAMFGEDRYGDELVELIARLDLTDRIELTGFTDDVRGVLARSDCLVHASTTAEPFGQVIIEGMAAGLAVIASDAGGPAEIIDDGFDGLLSAPGDIDALARQLRRVADDPELRRELGRNAALRSRDFEPVAVASLAMASYRRIVRSSSASARSWGRRRRPPVDPTWTGVAR